MKDHVIVDLDGTLCDCNHRSHLAQQGLWDDFNALCGEDEAHDDVACLLDQLHIAGGFKLIACTGRDDRFRPQTMSWLQRHAFDKMFETLLMRPSGNFSPDWQVKVEMLEAHFGSKNAVLDNVIFALDDRDKVVDGLRNYGIPVMQVRPGGY